MVLFPALLALIFIVGQAGLYYYARSVALAAAQEGARAASAVGATGSGTGEAGAFVARAGAQLLDAPTVTGTRRGDRVTVTVRGRSLSLVPGYPGFPVSQQASLPVERLT